MAVGFGDFAEHPHGPVDPAPGGIHSAEASALRRNYVVAVSYPLWHLAAPDGARDPWVLWWAVATSFALVEGLSLTSDWVARRLRHLLPLCSWLVTAHLYVLASWNDMHPFYVVGSAMAVITTFIFIRNRSGLLAYAVFLVALTATLYQMEPSTTKVAYWGGLLTVMPLAYVRLDLQLRREDLARDMADELEARVEARTREVLETNQRLEAEIAERKRLEGQLRLSHKMEVLGRIAGGLAHDFNNLLTTVNIYSDLVLDRLEIDTPLYRDAEQIQKTTRLASVLTQQLLDLSRGSVDTVPIDMNDAVQEVAAMARGMLPDAVEFSYQLSETPAFVRSGPDQLGRVLMNLVLNARDALPEGGRIRVEVDVCTEGLPPELHAEPGARYARLSVEDDGQGMDAETLGRAFDPFFTQKAERGGSGLGLSIVYGIVEQAGGHVRAESELGRGARFEVYWPVDEAAAAEPRAPGGVEPRTAGAERILLVEDETPLRVVLARVLSEAGYEVIEAPDGEAALAVLEGDTRGVDLVVTDAVMPNMNGYELAERLRSEHPRTRVLLMSAQPNHPSLGGREVPTGIELLAKPFEWAELATRVRHVLERPLAG